MDLEKLFRSKVRVKLLKLFMSDHSTDLHVRGIVRAVNEEINAVRRELSNLQDIGILTSKQRGNKLFYMLDKNCPIIPELTGLIIKNTPNVLTITKVLSKLDDFDAVYLLDTFFASGPKTAQDVELLIIGDNLKESQLAGLLSKIESSLKRDINVAVLSKEDIAFRQKQRDPFLLKILLQDKMLLLGDRRAMYG